MLGRKLTLLRYDQIPALATASMGNYPSTSTGSELRSKLQRNSEKQRNLKARCNFEEQRNFQEQRNHV
jgi:hypothetical protein